MLCDFLLMLKTLAVLLTVCEIEFPCRGWKSPFTPIIYSDCRHLYVQQYHRNYSINRWEVLLVGYYSVADSTACLIHLTVVATQICEITQNFDKIWLYSSWRSSKVIAVVAPKSQICEITWNDKIYKTNGSRNSSAVQGNLRCQSQAHMQLPISH